MKFTFTFLTAFALIATFQATPSRADDTHKILNSSLVTTTFSLMQAKHNGACEPLTEDSVHWMCMGLIMPASKLEIRPSSCGVAVDIKCPSETARISGQRTSVYAIDASGVRNDVANLDLGISFNRIEILAKP